METRAAARMRKDQLVDWRDKEEETGSLVPTGRTGNRPMSHMDLDAKGRIGKRGQAKSEKVMGASEGNNSGEGDDSGEAKRAREDEEERDEEAINAMNFRTFWESLWSKYYGRFEDITEIPPKRCTDSQPGFVWCRPAMQVFSVRLKEIKCGMVWPIEVYGHVTLRDSEDHKRNLIFNRGRDDCQTLTAKDRSLLLTGPSRAVVDSDSIAFEIELKVKGNTQREDKILSYVAYEFNCNRHRDKYGKIQRDTRSNKLSTVELTFAYLGGTVEATIEEVKVIKGSLCDFCPCFFACTNSLPTTQFVLLDPREGAMTINESGAVKLTRSVVSVELDGRLKLTAELLSGVGKAVAAMRTATFVPLKSGRSTGLLDFGFVNVFVTVAWSQFP